MAGDAIAIALGVAAIAWVNWYFFVAEARAARDGDAPPPGRRGARER